MGTVKRQSVLLLAVLLGISIGCGEEKPSFSLLADSDTFVQSAPKVNTKIDMLWVIDNSGSMQTSQDLLSANFSSFISDFKTKGYDFRIAVTTTDAYRALSQFNSGTYRPDKSRFRDGTNATSHTGIFVIDPSTPNLESIFSINALQGVSGSGDERAFMSFREALSNTQNVDFLREDSYLSVIIVSDEDDFSHDGTTFREDYNYAGLHTVQNYTDFMDTLTESSGADRRYSVSALAIFDQACYTQLTDGWPGRKLAQRYASLVEATGGVKGSLCGDFSQELNVISQQIIQDANKFKLSRLPIESSIVVKINGNPVPRVLENPGPLSGGWEYEAETNSIVFHDDYIPNQGDSIYVHFDPLQFD